MELDWFTLIAQVVNFLVLVWLLKHFLYSRIVQAMNDREAKILSRLEEAARLRAEAEQEAEQYRTRNRELDEQGEQLLNQAREEAETFRQQLMATARGDAEAAQQQWLETLQRERQELLQEFRENLGQQVFALARHTLKELADAELEDRILKVFIQRLESLNPAEREAIVAAARDPDYEVNVRTTFPLSPDAREQLTSAIRARLMKSINLRFTTSPDLICGIELRAHSHRIIWNLDAYLEGLETRLFEALDVRARSDGKLQ